MLSGCNNQLHRMPCDAGRWYYFGPGTQEGIQPVIALTHSCIDNGRKDRLKDPSSNLIPRAQYFLYGPTKRWEEISGTPIDCITSALSE